MADYVAENLLRVMAAQGLSLGQVAQRADVDQRTVRAILGGTNKPHARTLHRLAKGLAVSIDEFFLDPSQLLRRSSDRQTNPAVEEVIQAHQELFDGWSEADFDELYGRIHPDEGPTAEATLAAVGEMNRKRELHEKLDLLMESSQAELIGGMIDLAHGQVVGSGRTTSRR